MVCIHVVLGLVAVTGSFQDAPSKGVPLPTLRAEADYAEARLKRAKAEIELAEYEAGYPLEVEARNKEIGLAVHALVTRLKADGAHRIEERLARQKAEIELANSRKKLHVLERYSHPKTMKALESGLQSAREEEIACKDRFDRARDGKAG